MVRNKEKRRQIAKTTLVLLINIPIAILYVFLINYWDNTLRLTITNKHDTAITNVEISGSVSRSFSEIKAHAEKTIWVYNPDFCELKINYKEKGVSKSELIGNSIRGGGKASWGMGDGAISNGDMGCFNEPTVNSLHLTKQYVTLNKTPI